MDLKDLIPDPANRRKHTPRNLGMVADALREVGAARSIVIDENNVIMAGNGVSAAAGEAGITRVKVVEAAGDELVAVRRVGLTDEQKRALALYDNRTGELAEWDWAQLATDKAAGLPLAPWWTASEAAAWLPPNTGLTDADSVPAELDSTSIQRGDLFQLGVHRLLCGDATNADDVTRLMQGERATLFATDPPYAVGYEGGSHPKTRGNRASAHRNKDWSEDYQEANNVEDGATLYHGFVRMAVAHAITDRAAWYCWHASRHQMMVEQVWNDAGAFVHQQIIWAKSRPVLTYSVYLWQHEPCLFGWVKGNKPAVNVAKGAKAGTTVWQIPNSEVESHEHPTSKPVRIFGLPIDLHTDLNEICYEPFSGSGTQIIAAEQRGRRCFALELSPTFCQVTIDRWEAFTGQTAVKVAEAVRA